MSIRELIGMSNFIEWPWQCSLRLAVVSILKLRGSLLTT